MTIKELEEAYQQLHGRMLRGELDEASFKAEVERLRFEDDQGQQWKLGWYTGKWYRYDQGQWVQDQPRRLPLPGQGRPRAERGDAVEEPQSRRSATVWLVPALIALVVLAAVVLVVGWNAERWFASMQPTSALAAVTATALPPTDTPRPTATPTPTEPAPLPSPTPAPPRPTATATEAPTAIPSPTSSPTATPAPTEAASGPTPIPALSGRIYFPVYDPKRQTFDIYVQRLDTGARERVVEQASQPALSSDGERLAFRSWNASPRALQVLELSEGRTWTWINYAEAARPSWSPDSQDIVFPSQQEPDRQWRIYRSRGTEPDRIRRQGGDILGRTPTWLSDGRIVYWECPLSKCGLYVMQSDGTNPIRLTTYENDMAPAGSPAGQQIAFMTDRDGNWEIYIASTHPTGDLAAQRLTRNPARDGLPVWSPDGKWLAFASDRDGSWAVWAMRPDGSGQQKLFVLGGPLEGQIARVKTEEQAGWTWETLAWGR
jgi:TolB protein